MIALTRQTEFILVQLFLTLKSVHFYNSLPKSQTPLHLVLKDYAIAPSNSFLKKVIILCFSVLKKKVCCWKEILLISGVPKNSHSCYEFSHIKFCFFFPNAEGCTFILCTLSLTVASFHTHILSLISSHQLKQGKSNRSSHGTAI